jgi:hypothetical protein
MNSRAQMGMKGKSNTSMCGRGSVNSVVTLAEIERMLRAIVDSYGGRVEYDLWLRLISAVWSQHGFEESMPILLRIMPEEKAGEYRYKYEHRLRSITIGTLIHLYREACRGAKCPEGKNK